VKPFGRNGFYEALEDGGGRIGIERREDHNQVVFRGLRLR
jgi:hypothetical protein